MYQTLKAIYNPQPDITTYELALLLKLGMVRDNEEFMKEFAKLPPEMLRHMKGAWIESLRETARIRE